MLRTATPADLPRLADLLAEANDSPYDTRVVAEEKCFGRGVGGDPVARVFGDFLGIAVTCGKALRIIAVKREVLLFQNAFYGPDTRGYVMPPERAVNIDTLLDLRLAELLLHQTRENRA